MENEKNINEAYENIKSIITDTIKLKDDLEKINFYYKDVEYLKIIINELRKIETHILYEKLDK